jgi:hypothetical protein
MRDELGKDFFAACSRLRHMLKEKTGDSRLRDLQAWLDSHSKSVFLAALWSDDEASIAVRFPLTADIEFDSQMFIEAAESIELAKPDAARTERSSVVPGEVHAVAIQDHLPDQHRHLPRSSSASRLTVRPPESLQLANR